MSVPLTWTRRPVGRFATSESRRSRLAASSTRASSVSTSRRAEGSACGSAVTTRIVVDQSAHSYAGPCSCGCAPMAASVEFGRSVSADRLPHRAAYRYAMAVRPLRPPPERRPSPPPPHQRNCVEVAGVLAEPPPHQPNCAGWRAIRPTPPHQPNCVRVARQTSRIPGRVLDSVVITTVSVTRPQQLTTRSVVAAWSRPPATTDNDVSCCGAGAPQLLRHVRP